MQQNEAFIISLRMGHFDTHVYIAAVLLCVIGDRV